MLFAASPDLGMGDEPVLSIPGAPPRLDRPIEGCPFRPRCDSAFEACGVRPRLEPVAAGHDAACHLNTAVPA
jgi:oligopeptide/dipeptide ABC transporter ATP-binding protein